MRGTEKDGQLKQAIMNHKKIDVVESHHPPPTHALILLIPPEINKVSDPTHPPTHPPHHHLYTIH